MSIKLYRTTDRIPIKIGDATFKVSPFTNAQKKELQNALVKNAGDILSDAFTRCALLFKFAIKGVEGVEYATGGTYQLYFEEDGTLTDKCVEEIMSMEEKSSLSSVLWSFVVAIGNKALDPDGKPLKGVKILPPEGIEPTKK